jgi:hypothetical protein
MAMQDVIDRIFKQSPANTRNITMEEGATFSPEDDSFYVVGQADNTKRLKFDVSGLTTATDVTVTATDGGLTAGGLRSVVSNSAAVFATPTVLTAAMSGTTQLLDVATGIDFTLPAISAALVGMNFRFLLTVEPTSNSYRWTAATGDVLIGNIVIYDKDVAEGSTEALLQMNRPDGTDLICTITGTDDTQGSLVGGWIEYEAVSATGWFVRGVLIGDGALAQNFS